LSFAIKKTFFSAGCGSTDHHCFGWLNFFAVDVATTCALVISRLA